MTLTASVNEMKRPNQFLKRLLYGNHEPVATESIEVGLLQEDRKAAPFVRAGAEALMVQGHSDVFRNISAPNIRIKAALDPNKLISQRRPGDRIFVSGKSDVIASAQRYITQIQQGLEDQVINAEEYLISRSLQGVISYSVADEEVFTITFPRPAANNVTLDTWWDDADPDNVTLELDFHLIKSLASETTTGLPLTDAIMGSTAATAFLKLARLKNIPLGNINQGTIDFTTQFNEDGVIFLGTFSGVRLWQYNRSVILNGSSTDMIRTNYVEFISSSPQTERVLYYGAIPDMDAIENGNIVSERFSKSWKVSDPSARYMLVQSRPLPVPRRVDASFSVKVLA